MISLVVAGVVALLGIIGAIITITLWADLGGGGDAASGCAGLPPDLQAECERQVESATEIPFKYHLYMIMYLLGSLAAIGGAVLIYLKKPFAHYTILGGAVLVFLSSLLIFFEEGDSGGRPIIMFIFSLVFAAAGALGFFPQTKAYVGLGGSVLGGPGGYGPPPGSGGYGPPPGGGFGGPPPGGFGQQPPPPQGFGQQGGQPPQQW
jgi:hypothetical protein